MQAFAYDEMMNYPVCQALPEDSWFESMGLMVARDSMYTLAAKAGNNGDSHNHNDVGSFTIYKEGKPFIIDLGVGTYTQKTFSDKRYELWTMQSQFHNVPTFLNLEEIGVRHQLEISQEIKGVTDCLGQDPVSDAYNPNIILQKDGAKYAASDVSCILCTNEEAEDGKAVSSLKMDIAGAYEGNGKTSCDGEKQIVSLEGRYQRIVSLVKGKGVTVEDNYDGTKPFVMSLMTYEKLILKSVAKNEENSTDCTRYEIEGKSVSIAVGDLGTITVNGNIKRVSVQEYKITDERLAIAWKHSVYRILLEFDVPGKYEFLFD